ncbi:meiotic recombination protein DMC1 [Colletotrichum musicola]|uniref:Meiotic recombination protein DMC1 n=1 Tax=Colletotrichum musicola TaxID=2175873 RepID=A0A8H6KPN9_9PEZI|nr:meiotic recombination protein DMC1 [Colletotrichum musicola]
MAGASQSPGPGGFLPLHSLPSPAPSSFSARSNAVLPHPRSKSLRPGSSKEETVRRFVEERLAVVSRRYVKKHGDPEPGEDVTGYTNFAELCKDLHGVIDVLWLSATPSLQIPFFLNIASDFSHWVIAFPPSPRATFSVLTKLDHCFASLLAGCDIKTREPLPGFENGMRAGMTTTDMVRCRSSVEQTRVAIIEALSEKLDDDNMAGQEETDTEGATDNEANDDDPFGSGWNEDDDMFYMDVARIYEHTIIQLGERLGDVFGIPPQAVRTSTPNT